MKVKSLMPLIFLFVVNISCASTLYIGNKPTVFLRSSPSEKSNVVKELLQSTPVQLLKTDLRNGYSYIETSKKELGWVKTAYLVDHVKPKRETTKYKFWRRIVFWENTPTAKTMPPVMQTLPWQKGNKHASLQQKQVEIQAQLSQVQSQVNTLQSAINYRWFFFGACVAFLCFILGLLIGGARRRREPKWFK